MSAVLRKNGHTTAKIRELAKQGVPQAEIARQLGCTRSHVSVTLKRHLGFTNYFSPLSEDIRRALIRKADEFNMEPHDLARQIITDALAAEDDA